MVISVPCKQILYLLGWNEDEINVQLIETEQLALVQLNEN